MGSPQLDSPARAVRVIGRYHLHDEIGAGGMAVVHLGWMIDGARVVAMKRLRGDLARDPAFVDMFRDEARVALRVAHRNVVGALDLVSDDRDWFLVMEYVRGAALSHLLRRAKARDVVLPAPVAIGIAVGMLRGLQATHEICGEDGAPLNVIHRDVSPQNVIVGIDGRSRLLDFGVAKAKGRLQVTQVGELKGKLPYMAPEQLDEAAVSPATDVYAASAVLWEALSGDRLFQEDAERALDATEADEPCAPFERSRQAARRRRAAGITPPSARGADVSAEIDAIVLRGLHRLPARRYQSAGEMADALEACGAMASEEEIGAWVRSLEDPDMAARERMAAEVERYGRTEEEPAPVSAIVHRGSLTALERTRRMATIEMEALVEDTRPRRDLRGMARARRLGAMALLGIGVAAGIELEEVARPVVAMRPTHALRVRVASAKTLARIPTSLREEPVETESAPSPKPHVHSASKSRTHLDDEIPAIR